MTTIYQINLQEQFGGGEIYTRFFSRALIDLGYRVVLFVSRGAGFWDALVPPGVQLVRIARVADILRALPQERSLVVTQTALDAVTAEAVAARHVLCGFCHMPLYQRNPPGFRHYHLLFAVSQHVLDSIRSRGYDRVYAQPLYGVADLQRSDAGGAIVAHSEYDWDRRKLRDRLLGLIEGMRRGPAPAIEFSPKPGLTLGIVSRLTPIKQFPLMFGLLAPLIAKYPLVHLEIFGSGGYASVRDLRAGLAPVRNQTRFWGQQQDVAAIYPKLDFVLSGLPEKEALGLNLIEAQYCGTPVLAVRAPPFTETVVDGEGGYLFTDPRQDGGADFGQLLARLHGGESYPRPNPKSGRLAEFSYARFCVRVAQALRSAESGR
jgi:glycosyltransferase involved in cell wall biosynthesis